MQRMSSSEPSELHEEKARLTGDQLAAALYAEQGYLVVSYRDEFPMGVPFPASGTLKCNTPLIITGVSARAEYVRQVHRASEMCGLSLSEMEDDTHFYRVEAAD